MSKNSPSPTNPSHCHSARRARSGILLIGLLPGLVAIGCMSSPNQTAFMKARGAQLGATRGEMRLRTVSYAHLAAGLVEETADDIRAEATTPASRKAALRWKLHAIPMIQEAALQPDPLLAAVDLWTFALQMKHFFAEGDGRDAFGPHQPLAIATCERWAREGEQVLRAAMRGRDISKPQAKIEAFAAENPIRSKNLRRKSLASDFTDVLFSGSSSTFEAVANVEQKIQDIDYRLGFFNQYLLKQARWTVELALDDAADEVDVSAAMDLFDSSLEEMRALLVELPRLIEQQRDDLFAAVRVEREATLASIDAQRVHTLETLGEERTAILAGVAAEREAIMTALRSERDAAFLDLEGVAERSLTKVVDHAFWRLTQLAGAGTLGGLALFFGIRRFG